MSEPLWLAPGAEGPMELLRQLMLESMQEPHVDYLPHFMRAHGIPSVEEGSAVRFLIDHFARHLSVVLFREWKMGLELAVPTTRGPVNGAGFLCFSCLKERLTVAQGLGMSREPMKCKRHPEEEMVPYDEALERFRRSRDGA